MKTRDSGNNGKKHSGSESAQPISGDEPSDRQAMISQAAYYAAERRGFAAGSELEDWLSAERQVAEQLDGATD